MPRQTPTTSTVRTALHVSEQFEELLRPGRRGEPIDPEDVAACLSTIIRGVRKLQTHQVDDLCAHLDAIAEEEPKPRIAAVDQLDRLAAFLIESPLSEPARDEEAVDTAIRLIGRLARREREEALDYPASWRQPREDGPGPEAAMPDDGSVSEPDVAGGEDTIKPDDDVRETAENLRQRVHGD